MFQESVDRAGNSPHRDTVLVILLVLIFFSAGAAAIYLEKSFGSRAPRYVFIGVMLIAAYLVYKIRLVGFRYTVFYKSPEPEYDPRFDDMMLHEDYPYPVGTIVFERIASAKGNTLAAIARDEITDFLKPGEEPNGSEAVPDNLNCACCKIEKAHSLIYKRDGKLHRVYFKPSEEFISYINIILNTGTEAPAGSDSAEGDEKPAGTEA